MHIHTEIEEEEEEHIISSSEDDDVEDENYQISPRIARGAALDDDKDEDMADVENEPRRQVEEEEEDGSQQRGMIPFHPKQTIRRPHKPLSYNAKSYGGKGTTKDVKGFEKLTQDLNKKELRTIGFTLIFSRIFMKL
jgi:hypothetical protein